MKNQLRNGKNLLVSGKNASDCCCDGCCQSIFQNIDGYSTAIIIYNINCVTDDDYDIYIDDNFLQNIGMNGNKGTTYYWQIDTYDKPTSYSEIKNLNEVLLSYTGTECRPEIQQGYNIPLNYFDNSGDFVFRGIKTKDNGYGTYSAVFVLCLKKENNEWSVSNVYDYNIFGSAVTLYYPTGLKQDCPPVAQPCCLDSYPSYFSVKFNNFGVTSIVAPCTSYLNSINSCNAITNYLSTTTFILDTKTTGLNICGWSQSYTYQFNDACSFWVTATITIYIQLLANSYTVSVGISVTRYLLDDFTLGPITYFSAIENCIANYDLPYYTGSFVCYSSGIESTSVSLTVT